MLIRSFPGEVRASDVAESNLERAQNNMDYTQLFAPFDGVVARRLAENFESVSPGQVALIIVPVLYTKFYRIPYRPLAELD